MKRRGNEVDGKGEKERKSRRRGGGYEMGRIKGGKGGSDDCLEEN